MPKRLQTGVTLIELVIGLAVFGILTMLALPSFTAWLQNLQIRAATESIQNGLQTARAEAIRRNAQVSFSMAGPDSSWNVAVVSTAENIQTRAGTEGSPNAQITTTDPVIVFDGLGKANLAANATIQVTNPQGGACGTGATSMRCLDVTVAVGGQIRMCDPQVTAAGDTRKC